MAKMYNKNWNSDPAKSNYKKIINKPTIQDVIRESGIIPPNSISEVLKNSGAMPTNSISEVLENSGVNMKSEFNMMDYIKNIGNGTIISGFTDDVIFMDDKLCISSGMNDLLPHFHFSRFIKSNLELPLADQMGGIMIDRPLYIDHDGFQGRLDESEMNELIEFLKSKHPNKENISVWNFLVKSWNDNNPLRILDVNIPIPEYKYDMPKYE